jgi:hypothetical protein
VGISGETPSHEIQEIASINPTDPPLIKIIDFGLAHRPKEPDFGLLKWKAKDSSDCLEQDAIDLAIILCEIRYRSIYVSKGRGRKCLDETRAMLGRKIRN